MRTVAAALCFALAFSLDAGARDATESEVEIIRAAMAEKLRDAEAARFLDVQVLEHGVVCGKVNSKNAFGAYAGYTVFTGSIFAGIDRAIVLRVDAEGSTVAARMCTEKGYEK